MHCAFLLCMQWLYILYGVYNKNINTVILYNRFIVPISIVICNDIMAYLFGFFFGRTPLIKVSHLIRLWFCSKTCSRTCKITLCFHSALSEEDLGRLYWRLLCHSGLWLHCKFVNFKSWILTTQETMQSLHTVFLSIPVCLPAGPVPVLCLSGRVQQWD